MKTAFGTLALAAYAGQPAQQQIIASSASESQRPCRRSANSQVVAALWPHRFPEWWMRFARWLAGIDPKPIAE